MVGSGPPRTRKRQLPGIYRTGRLIDSLGNVTYHPSEFVGFEETRDHKNAWHLVQKMKKSSHRWADHIDVGGDFYSIKHLYGDRTKHFSIPADGRGIRFEGPLYPSVPKAIAPSIYWATGGWANDDDLLVAGSTAISRCQPTNSHAELLVSLGELYREGLPSLAGLTFLRGRGTPSSTAGEYLNYEFGIKPLVSDVKSIASTVMKADSLLKQYMRDSGRYVRRSYAFPEEVETTVTSTAGVYPVGGARITHFASPGVLRDTMTVTRKRWFDGAFTYYADPKVVGRISSIVKKAEYLYGLNPSLDDLWNLTPWSWAVDWFTNIGDVMNNISSFVQDGLVMRYGYVMEEFSEVRTLSLHGCTTRSGEAVNVEQTFTTHVKQRRRASPWGFGLTEEAFTPRQWAILAALGITQGGSLSTRYA